MSQPNYNMRLVEFSSKFDVLSAYEDFEMGKQAEKTFEYLVRHLGSETEVNHQMWRFDVLAVPKLREIAIADGSNASIIVIASRNGNLPSEVKWWLEQVIESDSKAAALVALVGAPAKFDTVRVYLAELAYENGLDYFSQPEIPTGFSGNLSTDRIHKAEKSFLKPPDTRQTSGYLHWGLNE